MMPSSKIMALKRYQWGFKYSTTLMRKVRSVCSWGKLVAAADWRNQAHDMLLYDTVSLDDVVRWLSVPRSVMKGLTVPPLGIGLSVCWWVDTLDPTAFLLTWTGPCRLPHLQDTHTHTHQLTNRANIIYYDHDYDYQPVRLLYQLFW